MLTDWVFRLRSIFKRDTVEQELDDELQFHLEQHINAYVNAGLDPDAARRRARLEFGNPEQVREEHRDARGVRAIEDLLHDLRYAGRQLKRAPGFTVLAVVALALGIGATVTVFKVVNAVFLKPLPFERADELYRLAKVSPSGAAQWLTVQEFNRWPSENLAWDLCLHSVSLSPSSISAKLRMARLRGVTTRFKRFSSLARPPPQ